MEILKLNEISSIVNNVFTSNYKTVKESSKPDAIMLRSFNMHEYTLADTVTCVGRCGAGVNNIPLDKYASQGVVVFNSPGANANAVKELVILSMLMSCRKVADSLDWAKTLNGKGSEVAKLVEGGKSAFIGGELLGKKVGVVGLGAIGVLVANACLGLGMSVVGYDPYLSVKGALNLNPAVKTVSAMSEVFADCDFISLHVPLTDTTKQFINSESIATMKDGVSIINCSRGELVDNKSIIKAVADKKVNRYVTDFPVEELLCKENIIAIPHLGASTPEAEDNCAFMVANQIMDFNENGNIVNSVNFPALSLPRSGKARFTVAYTDSKDFITSLTKAITSNGGSLSGMISGVNKTGQGYVIVDTADKLNAKCTDAIKKLAGVIKMRVIG